MHLSGAWEGDAGCDGSKVRSSGILPELGVGWSGEAYEVSVHLFRVRVGVIWWEGVLRAHDNGRMPLLLIGLGGGCAFRWRCSEKGEFFY